MIFRVTALYLNYPVLNKKLQSVQEMGKETGNGPFIGEKK